MIVRSLGRWRPLRRSAALIAVAAGAFALALACGQPPAPAESDAAAEPVTVVAAVDRSTATVGDPVRYVVEVRHPQGVEPRVAVPVSEGLLGGLPVVDSGVERPRRPRGAVVERHWWLLRPGGTGSFVLPPAVVTLDAPDGQQRFESSEVFVEVASVLPEDAEDIRDVKPPRPRSRWGPWAWAGGALLAAVAALLFWRWWRKRRERTAATPVLAPHELALRDLDRLRRTDFSSLAELRRYYFEISEVLRRYVEARFGLNATDLTTEEILGRLGQLRELHGAESISLREFLLATDRVKYAAEVPTESEIEQTYELALSFVESTKPREPEVGAPSGPGSGGPEGPPSAPARATAPSDSRTAEPAARRRAVG